MARVRASDRTILSFEIDDAGLRAKMEKLSPEKLNKDVFMPVLLATLKTLQRRSVSVANTNGLNRTDVGANNGWEWQRKARIPASIRIGKRWRIKGYAAGRVFIGRGKQYDAGKRAHHANPLIAGYRQFVPTGIPGKGNVRFTKMQPPRPLFALVIPQAQKILTDTLKRALKKLKV